MHIPGPQYDTHQLSPLPIKNHQRMIHVLIVVAMKKRELLLAMSGVIRRINIQHDHLWSLNEGAHILFLNLTNQGTQLPDVDGVL
jgi:hypothetical protein